MTAPDAAQTTLMVWFFALLILCLAGAAATALVRGLFAFYQDGELLKQDDAALTLQRGTQQNRMMAQRVFFQGLAILMIVLLGAYAA